MTNSGSSRWRIGGDEKKTVKTVPTISGTITSAGGSRRRRRERAWRVALSRSPLLETSPLETNPNPNPRRLKTRATRTRSSTRRRRRRRRRRRWFLTRTDCVARPVFFARLTRRARTSSQRSTGTTASRACARTQSPTVAARFARWTSGAAPAGSRARFLRRVWKPSPTDLRRSRRSATPRRTRFWTCATLRPPRFGARRVSSRARSRSGSCAAARPSPSWRAAKKPAAAENRRPDGTTSSSPCTRFTRRLPASPPARRASRRFCDRFARY
mmetsp:Transcript_13805/g.59076  ORF Transcript_13805/g.59076 Transcript_13805/m.59076 type:complete len:271 (-) Transcript_13805:553-1365(-)